VDGECVAFGSYCHQPHPKAKNVKRSHRTVVLPDWQGLGIGLQLTNAIGEMLAEQGWRFRATLAHPSLVSARMRSPRWRLASRPMSRRQVASGPRANKTLVARNLDTRGLGLYCFEYVPERAS
jgi:GNAT superfamily N-acetyltransferase